MKKIILLIIACSFIFSIFSIENSSALEFKDLDDIPVYTSDEYGNIIESKYDVSFFLNMLEDKNYNQSTYAIPTPEYNSVRITDIRNETVNRNKIKNEVNAGIIGLSTFVWTTYKSSIINVATKLGLKKDLFEGIAIGYAAYVANKLSNNSESTVYLTSYMYKTYSDYYGCYLLHYCLFEYSDSQRKNIKSVYHDYVFSNSHSVKYIGLK